MKITSLKQLQEEGVSHNPDIKKKVMLKKGDVPGLTNFSQARFAPGQAAPAHAHSDMYEVFFVESGAGVIRVDEVEHFLEPGVCITVEPGEQHEVVNTGSADLVLTYFSLLV